MSSSSSSSTSAVSPTVRSRTLLFLSYRDSRARSNRFSRSQFNSYHDSYTPADEHEGLINKTDTSVGHVALEVDLPPKWSFLFRLSLCVKLRALICSHRVDISEQVEEILADTQAKSMSLSLAIVPEFYGGFLTGRPPPFIYLSLYAITRSHLPRETPRKTRPPRIHGPIS